MGQLRMDSSGGVNSINTAVLALNLAGQSQVELGFYQRNLGDDATLLPVVEADGVTIDLIRATTNFAPGSEIDVESSLGTVVDDVNPGLPGNQVLVVAGGGAANEPNSFEFHVRRPTISGTPALITTGPDDRRVASIDAGLLSYVVVGTRRYDFNTPGSPTMAAYVEVLPTDIYIARTTPHGWVSPVMSFDHFLFGDPRADLLRDGHSGTISQSAVFHADLPPDLYQINITVGDNFAAIDNMRITHAENGPAVNFNVLPTSVGQFTHVSITVDVLDGRLGLLFQDMGGVNDAWVVNGIEIIPFADTSIQFTGLGTVVPDGATVDTISGTYAGAMQGDLLTVTIGSGVLGMIVSADESALYVGIQVRVGAAGKSDDARTHFRQAVAAETDAEVQERYIFRLLGQAYHAGDIVQAYRDAPDPQRAFKFYVDSLEYDEGDGGDIEMHLKQFEGLIAAHRERDPKDVWLRYATGWLLEYRKQHAGLAFIARPARAYVQAVGGPSAGRRRPRHGQLLQATIDDLPRVQRRRRRP